MNNNKTGSLKFMKITVTLCFAIFTALIYAQSPTVDIERSNNKITLDGVNYYIHIVRKGESLFALSKVYNVPVDSIKKDNKLILANGLQPNQYIKMRITDDMDDEQKFNYHTVIKGDTPFGIAKKYNSSIDEIYKNNPNSDMGLSIGQIIKIPINETNKTAVIEVVELTENNGFIVHTVEKKQTLYGISVLYKTTVDDIKKANPEIESGNISIGQQLKIPASQQTIESNDEYNMHMVAKQETIYGICKMYDIKNKQLTKLNPEIETTGLQVGMLLRIPKNNFTDNVIKDNQTPTSVNNYIPTTTVDNKANYDTIQYITPVKVNNFNKDKIYKVAFFLPLYLNMVDTSVNENTGKRELKIYPKAQIFLEFYEGALLALRELQTMGVSFDVHVFDTRNDSNTVAEILKNPALKGFNLFIGPVFSDNLDKVGDFAWEHQINIVSPLSIKSSFIEHNPYSFQVSPPFHIQMKHASEFLNSIDTKNYIVIHDGNDSEQEYISKFKEQLFAQMTDDNFAQFKYNEVHYYDARDSVLKNVFSPNIENIVIVPSQNRAFVSDVIGKLNGYSHDYNIITFGQPRWLTFDNIELENFHNTKTHIFSNSYIDYNNENVKSFVRKYRNYYKNEPDRFAFQGYDITYYFCSALNMYGHEFRRSIHLHHPDLLQTDYNFVPYTDQGGYLNSSIYILEFTDDYLLKKVASYPGK